MFRTVVRRAKAHTPSIHFPDRRLPPESHTRHPHPQAPKEVAKEFGHFQEVFESGPHFHPEKVQEHHVNQSGQPNGGKGLWASDDSNAVEDVQQLPERFWKTPALEWEQPEMDAIMTGGATLVQKS